MTATDPFLESEVTQHCAKLFKANVRIRFPLQDAQAEFLMLDHALPHLIREPCGRVPRMW